MEDWMIRNISYMRKFRYILYAHVKKTNTLFLDFIEIKELKLI